MKPTQPAYRNLSCQYITEALLRLMETEHYEDITVSKITEEAGVARRTFYLNYTSREDVLDQHYETLIREYDAGMSEQEHSDMTRQAVYFFRFWKQHRAYAELLEKNGMLYLLIGRFHLYLDRTPSAKPAGFSKEEQEYMSSYIAGGLWMMLRTWLQNGFRETPEQLGELSRRLTAIGK